MFPTVYVVGVAVLAVGYCVVMGLALRVWQRLPAWHKPKGLRLRTSISVVIAARNEAAHIVACLEALRQQAYPKARYEVILVDDYSTDNTAELATACLEEGWTLIRLEEKGVAGSKKAALAAGIAAAKGRVIVTTDADCVPGPEWLASFAAAFEVSGAVAIAAPVNFYMSDSILQRFQALDFVGMMGLTAAGIKLGYMHLANGANLAYTKAAFKKVGGFDGIDQVASGDDVLLMQKLAKKYPTRITFLKTLAATVYTNAKPTLAAFLRQRIRWASKTRYYHEWAMWAIPAWVFIWCVSIVSSFLLAPFFGWPFFLLGVAQLALKAIVDFFFLRDTARFFQCTQLLQSFWPAQILHIAYILVVGLYGPFAKTYNWKGRKTQ